MIRRLLLLSLFVVLVFSSAFSQTFVWGTTLAGSSSQWIRDVDVDPDGNVIVGGWSYSNASIDTIDLTCIAYDGIVAKLNSDGDALWAQRVGGTSQDGISLVEADMDGNVLVAGFFFGTASIGDTTITGTSSTDYDAYVAKFDPDGDLLWVKVIPGAGGQQIAGLASDGAGNVVVQIFFNDALFAGATSFSNSASSYYNSAIIKFDSSGAFQWKQQIEGEVYTAAITSYAYNMYYRFGGLDVDSAGNIYATGTFVSGDTLEVGSLTTTSYGGLDAYLVKFNSSGTPQWLRHGGGTSSDYGCDVAVDNSGNVFLTGWGYSSMLFGSISMSATGYTYVVRYNSSGSATWGDRPTGNAYYPTIDVDNQGSFYLSQLIYGANTTVTYASGVAYTNVVTTNSYTPMFVKRDYLNGSWEWATGPTANPYTVYTSSIAARDPDYVYGAGMLYGSMGFGNVSLSGSGWDGFVTHIANCDYLIANAYTIGNDTVICDGEEIEVYADTNSLYDYQWLYNGAVISGEINDSYTVDDDGAYSVVIDSAGCIDTSDVVNITVAAPPNVTHSNFSAVCDGDDPFLLTGGNPSGGSYSGSGVISGDTFDPGIAALGNNVIWYSYTDANGCTDSVSKTINVGQSPAIFTTSITACEGDGPISLSGASYGFPTGGSHSGTGVSGNQFYPSVAGPGTHYIYYSSSAGCFATDSITATVTASPSVNLTAPSTACATSSTPIVLTGSPSGGTFLWNSISSQLFYPSLAGIGNVMVTYSVTQSGCTAIDTEYIYVDTVPTVTIATLPTLCEDDDTLGLTTYGTPSGGTFSGTGVSSNVFDPATSSTGTFTITYSYTNGCGTYTDTESLTVSPTPSISISSTDVSCNGGSDGSATATPSGGSSPYSYAWSGGGGSAATANNLSAGTYTVTVTDNNGCEGTSSVTINEPTQLIVITSATAVSCNGGSNGAVSSIATGGTSSYSYLWSNGSTSSIVTGMSAGTYTVTATDANGCTATATATITEPTAVVASIGTPTNVSCNGGSDGSATASGSGGTSPYSFAWSGGAGSSATATGLSAGTYTVTVTDANGCSDTETVTITEPTPVVASIGTPTNVSCNGGSDGSATASGSGGTSPYSYAWSGGGSSATATGLSAGTYTVTVTDANGCTDTETVSITQPATAVTVSITSSTNVSCNGGTDGAATASGSGGTGTITYAWSGGAGSSATATTLSAGTYTVTATDANGCTDTASVTITEPTAVVASISSSTNVSCNGGSDGSATAAGSGGTSPYSFAWSGGGGSSATATGLSAGTYTITVTDANGCTDTETVTITEPTAVVASIGTPTNVSCNGGSDGSATASGSGGTSPYSFAWSGGAGSSATATGLSAGTYTVTVTDANGCSDTETVTITEPTPVVASIGTPTNVSCNGGSDGSATASGSGGTSPYSYAWSGGGSSATATGLSAGTYTVTVTDANGCTDTETVSITQPATAVTVSITSSTNVSCNGGTDGAATASGSGGTGTITYAWSGGAGSSATATTLSAGTYTVTATDANGCTDTASVTITEPTAVVASISSSTNVSCNGGSDGSATAAGSGGTSPYSFAWSGGGGSSATATGLSAGTYTITVTDANGCTDTETVTITEPTAVVASIGTPTNVSCNGGSDGSATASGSGGTSPYSFAWSGGAGSSATATGLSAGTYTVTVTDANGCSDTETVTITEPTPVVASIGTPTNVSCNGGSDGSATASGSGGTSPYSYAWSGGGSSATATGLSAGTYTVTVTDANGCTDTETVSITQPATAVTVSITSSTNVSCNGGTDGAATASGSGGTGTITYAWSGGAGSSATATTLSAGTYTVTATDANGCTDTASVTITEPTAVVASISSSTNVSCNGGSDGSATAAGSGGTSPYSFAWSGGGGSSATATGLSAGTYTITVTDANGCTDTETVTITEPTAVVASIGTPTNVSCNGGSDGSATASGSGGTSPYSFAWSGGAGSSATATGLSAGTYTVTVTDANGCSDTETVTITEPTPVVASIGTPTNVSCNGGSDGSATASGSGGTSPYSYAWSGGGSSATATSLSAGTYTVTVTDANGCTDTETVSITQPATAVTVSITSSTNVSCNGGTDGAATASGSGGTGTITYAWSGGAGSSATATTLAAGTYTVTATDANGCTDTASVTITEPTAVVASISSSTNVSCNGGSDGSATAAGSGGTSPYSYAWSGGAGSSATATGLSAGTYTITVTDANGCTDTETVTITEPTAVVASIGTPTNVSCNGGSDGSATASGSGGTSPYSFAWSGGAGSSATATGLSAGTYTVTVTDANGCSDTETVTITEPTPTTASISSSTNLTCFGSNDGSATAAGSGGTSPYTYVWSSGAVTATASGLAAGTFTVTVTDANGCTQVASVTITQPIVLATTVSLDNNVSCNGGNDGGASVSVSGGTSPYTYLWSSSETSTSADSLSAGTAFVTVTDANGCEAIDSIQITEPNVLSASIGSSTNVSCNAGSDGSATVSVSGGTTAYAYAWSGGGGTAVTASGLSAGTYTVTVTDANGCTDTASVTLTEPSAITISTSATNVSCNGANDGSITASTSGGTPGYSYLWSTAATSATVTNLSPGNYSVTVTDANGCAQTATQSITEPTVLTASTSVDNNVNCNGGSDGSATASGSGGTSPYTFAWSSGGTAATETGLSAGTFTVTVTDANGCTDTETVSITEPTLLVASAGVDSNTTCASTATGVATASAVGGASPYSYAWSTGSTSFTATGLGTGTYCVTVTDANGCIDTACISIVVEDTVAPTVITQNINAYIDAAGSVTISSDDVDNGSSDECGIAYKMLSDSLFDCTNLFTPITVVLTVGDVNGNVDSAMAVVTVVDTLAPTAASISALTLYIDSAGSASITTTQIDSSSTDNCSIDSLWLSQEDFYCADTSGSTIVMLYAMDESGNVDSSSTSITVFDTMVPVVIGQNVTVYLDFSGNATIDTTFINTSSFDNCAIDTMWLSRYSFSCADVGAPQETWLHAIDISGNLDSNSYSVTVIDSFAPVIVATDTTVYLNAAGSATIDTTYLNVASFDNCEVDTMWLSQYVFSCADTAAPQSVMLYVQDGYGNVDSAQQLVTVMDSNSPIIAVNDTTLYLPVSGSVTVTANALDNGTSDNCSIASMSIDQSTFDCADLGVNNVIFTATDVSGNASTETFLVTVIDTLTNMTVTVDTALLCAGDSNGAATASATGFTAGYTYLWSDGQTTASATGLASGTYYVTATSAGGCEIVDSVTFVGPAGMNGALTAQDITCFGGNNGWIASSVSGGTASYSYVWNSGATTDSIGSLTAGLYSLTVTDANGCTIELDTLLSQPTQVDATISASVTSICSNDSSATLTISVTGGAGGMYDKLWDIYGDTSSADTINNVGAGTFYVIVTDSFGCMDVDSITIDENPLPALSFEILEDTACAGVQVTLDSVSPAGGVWSGAGVDGDTLFTDTLIGTQYVTYAFTDSNGCSNTIMDSIHILPQAIISFTSDPVELCAGEQIALNFASPAGGVYTSQFSDGDMLVAPDTVYSGIGGWYVFENACGVDSDTFSLLVHPLPMVDLGPDTMLCNATGMTLTAGTHAGYLWSTGETSSSILLNGGEEPLTEDQIIWVQVASTEGCLGSDTLMIDVIEQPTFYLGDNTDICLDEELTLSVPNVYDNFLWSDSSTGLSILAHDGTMKMPGTYQFWALGYNEAGCSYSDTLYLSLIDCDGTYVGIEEVGGGVFGFDFYPNPAADNVNLVLNASADDLRSVGIYGAMGEVVRTFGKADWSSNGHEDEVLIELGEIANGIYLIQVNHAEGTSTKRLVIGR